MQGHQHAPPWKRLSWCPGHGPVPTPGPSTSQMRAEHSADPPCVASDASTSCRLLRTQHCPRAWPNPKAIDQPSARRGCGWRSAECDGHPRRGRGPCHCSALSSTVSPACHLLPAWGCPPQTQSTLPALKPDLRWHLVMPFPVASSSAVRTETARGATKVLGRPARSRCWPRGRRGCGCSG